MFYKEKLVTKEQRKLFEDNHSFEFALAIQEKLQSVGKNIDIYELKGESFSRYLAVQNTLSEKKDIFMLGDYATTGRFFLESMSQDLKIDNLTFQKVSEEHVKNKKINQKVLGQAKEFVSSFYKEKKEFEIKDKFGESYKVKITENVDHTLYNSFREMDILEVFKENKRVGYIKALYSSQEMFDQYYPTKLHLILDEMNKDYYLTNEMTKEEMLNVLESKDMIRNVDYSNVDEEFNNTIKKLNERSSRDIKETLETLNTGMPQYSKLEDNFKGKGLAQLMYFHIAKHFNEKDITWKSGMSRTEEAEHLWTALKEKFPNNITIKEKKWYSTKKEIYYLKVEESEDAFFENGVLKHTNSIVDFLENKKEDEVKRKIKLKKK